MGMRGVLLISLASLAALVVAVSIALTYVD
jgi:hypothetical protein